MAVLHTGVALQVSFKGVLPASTVDVGTLSSTDDIYHHPHLQYYSCLSGLTVCCVDSDPVNLKDRHVLT